MRHKEPITKPGAEPMPNIRQVNTSRGIRYALTIAPAPKWFWDMPRDRRPEFASVKKYNDQWQLTIWGETKAEVQHNFDQIAPKDAPARRRTQSPRQQQADVRIEFPSRGQTYCRQEYGVYKYGVYPSTSVLAGQQMRSFVNSYPTLAEAQAKHPEASYNGPHSTGYRKPYVDHLSPDGDPEPESGEFEAYAAGY